MNKILLLIYSLLVPLVYTEVYVQAQSNIEKVQIRIGEAAQLNFPTFPFENIYQKWISLVDNNNAEFPYQYCSQVDEQISFNQMSSFDFQFQRQAKDVIYNFEDLKYRQGVIDAIVIGNTINVVFQNGNLIKVTINNDGKLSQNSLLKFPNVTRLSYGKLVQVDKVLIFVSIEGAYSIEDQIYTIQNYQAPVSLNNVMSVLNNYVAIAAGNEGILIYKYQNRSLVNSIQIDKDFLMRFNNPIDITDIAYNKTTANLYVLDSFYGVTVVNLTLENGILNPKLWKTSTSSKIKQGCDNILLVNESMYLTCGQIFKYDKRNELQIPDPLFKVKEIIAYSRFFIVFGENIFKVYYADSLVEYDEFDDMDKFFLYDKFYIGINQYGINYGQYDFEFMKIVCMASDPQMEGTVNLILQTQAECNQGYFKKYNLNINVDQNETCVYTVPIQIQYWLAKDVHTKVILVVAIILAVLIVSILIWGVFVRRNRSNLQALLQKYINPNEVQKGGYDNMVQQKQEQKKEEHKTEQQKKQSIQMEVKHDIGE